MCGVFVYIYIYMCVCCAGNVCVSAPVMRGIFARKRENGLQNAKHVCVYVYVYIYMCVHDLTY